MIEFFKVIEAGWTPHKADKSANGTLPTNGYRYCEPVRTASAFGWYVYLPMEIWVSWSGSEYRWTIDQGENWYVLADAIQFPGFAERFDEAAPQEVRGYSPPFLSRTNDPDILQIWTGTFVRTRKDLGVYVRSPVNLHGGLDYSVLEGVVQTEWWFGPLFANIRVLRRESPVVFRADRPFIQLQPFSNLLFSEFEKSQESVGTGLDALSDEEWAAYRRTVVRRMETRKQFGQYAAEARQRAKAADRVGL